MRPLGRWSRSWECPVARSNLGDEAVQVGCNLCDLPSQLVKLVLCVAPEGFVFLVVLAALFGKAGGEALDPGEALFRKNAYWSENRVTLESPSRSRLRSFFHVHGWRCRHD